MDKKEIRDLAISEIVLAVVFTRIISGMVGVDIYLGFIYSLILVGLSFLIHELAHRTIARRCGAMARYKMSLMGIIFALILSVISGGRFVFAAPGAVYISGLKALRWKGEFTSLRNHDYGLISASGPLTNMIIAAFFVLLNYFYPWSFFHAGAYINIFIAFFNLLPIPPFDGSKIMRWDRKTWLALFVVALIGWIGFLAL